MAKGERDRERGCCWGRDKDELALSTLVAGVAVAGVGEDDGFSLSACYFSFIYFFCYCFCIVTQWVYVPRLQKQLSVAFAVAACF